MSVSTALIFIIVIIIGYFNRSATILRYFASGSLWDTKLDPGVNHFVYVCNYIIVSNLCSLQ